MSTEAKPRTDWESIERAYRAGVLSIREIAKQHDVSDTAIRKKAKADGWERDLTAKVQEKVRTELVRAQVRTANAEDKARTEREIIDSAAATVVQVVREHRKDIESGRRIVSSLMEQLTDAAATRAELEETVREVTADDKTAQRRTQLMKAISLPAHAGVIRDLSSAMKNLIPLERQAFNIGAEIEDPTPEAVTDEDLDRAIAVYAAKAGIGIAAAGES